MAIATGLLFIKETMPSLWEWIPNYAEDLYDKLVDMLQEPEIIREIENSLSGVPAIPFIDPYIHQLAEISQMPEKIGELINVQRMKSYFSITDRFDKFRATSYNFEYNEECGGYLYRGEVWDDDKIEKIASEIPPAEAPLLRPEMGDIRALENQYKELSEDESEIDISPRRQEEEEAIANLRNHLISVLSQDDEFIGNFLHEAKSNVANDMLDELRSFTSCIYDELTVIKSQFGKENESGDRTQQQGISVPSQRALQRIFPGFSIRTWTEVDSEGDVYGWEDQVTVLKVTKEKEQYLVCITPQLKKPDASSALRLFKFFKEASDSEWKNAIVSSSCSAEATSILQDNGILLYNFCGDKL